MHNDEITRSVAIGCIAFVRLCPSKVAISEKMNNTGKVKGFEVKVPFADFFYHVNILLVVIRVGKEDRLSNSKYTYHKQPTSHYYLEYDKF